MSRCEQRRRWTNWTLVAVFSLLAAHARGQPVPPEIDASILESVGHAVASIHGRDADGFDTGTGTAFFISPDEVVTARHGMEGVTGAFLRLADGSEREVLGVLGDDRAADLLVLRVAPAPELATPVTPLTLSDCPSPEGTQVAIVTWQRSGQVAVSHGQIHKVFPPPFLGGMLVLSATAAGGWSGSPVVDPSGRVVGVVSAGHRVTFAPPVARIAGMPREPLRTLAQWWTPQETPRGPALRRAFWRGVSSGEADDHESALAHFRYVTDLDPLHAYAWHTAASSLSNLGRTSEAIAAFQEYLALEPTDPMGWLNLGSLQARTGYLSSAAASFRRVIELDPDGVEGYDWCARVQLTCGRYGESEALCRAAIRLRPGDALLHVGLGRALLGLGRGEEAVGALQSAIGLDARQTEPYRWLACAFAGLGREEDRRRTVASMLSVAADDATARLSLAVAYRDSGFTEAAVEVLREAIAADAAPADLHVELCDLLAAEGRWAELLSVSSALVAADPTSVDGWRFAGNARARLGQWSEAVDAFNRALALGPERRVEAAVLDSLCQAQRMVGDEAGFEEALARLRAIDPGLAPAWEPSEEGGE